MLAWLPGLPRLCLTTLTRPTGWGGHARLAIGLPRRFLTTLTRPIGWGVMLATESPSRLTGGVQLTALTSSPRTDLGAELVGVRFGAHLLPQTRLTALLTTDSSNSLAHHGLV